MTFACEPGRPWPLGASLRDGGVNFAVFSGVADQVEICLFDADGQRELQRIALPGRSDAAWHGFVPGLAAGALYGLRVHGPYQPDAGQRCNPAKLLLDPYARALDRPLRARGLAVRLHPGQRGTGPAARPAGQRRRGRQVRGGGRPLRLG
jgi:isoamylase